MPGPDLDFERRRVEAFVLRARRVKAHSLGRDDDALEGWATPRYKFRIYDDRDDHDLIDEVPPEEAIESLAARIRPFILQGDPVFYGTALKALKSLLWAADAHEFMEGVDALRSQWRTADPNVSGGDIGLFRTIGSDGQHVEVTDRDLARGWFYADLVHADRESHPVVTKYSLRDRYRAAVTRVALLALAARDTLALVEWLYAEEIVPLSESAFSEKVEISELLVVRTGVQIFQGEDGAVSPGSAGEKLDPGVWRKMTIGDLKAQWGLAPPPPGD